MDFHHTALRVRQNRLADAVLVLRECGLCNTVSIGTISAICFARGGTCGVQLIEAEDRLVPQRDRCHIAFLDEDPKAAAHDLAMRLRAHGLDVVEGCWSEAEQWLDVPDVFTDAVIEILSLPQ
jgi:hypothetical protein